MIPFKQSGSLGVTADEMKEIYEKIKTPKKLGPVLKWEKEFTDSATVFQILYVLYIDFQGCVCVRV